MTELSTLIRAIPLFAVLSACAVDPTPPEQGQDPDPEVEVRPAAIDIPSGSLAPMESILGHYKYNANGFCLADASGRQTGVCSAWQPDSLHECDGPSSDCGTGGDPNTGYYDTQTPCTISGKHDCYI